MKILELPLKGVFLIVPEERVDDRGFFARLTCSITFEHAGLVSTFVQSNLSYNTKKGTLRGLHWQDPPFAEVKLVSVAHGSIYDVVVDLRPDSQTYLDSIGVYLEGQYDKPSSALYISEGMAHGYLTLKADTAVHYHVSAPYAPTAARGRRWDDPAFRITLPLLPTQISRQDTTWVFHQALRYGTHQRVDR